ncbi:hypothetical protein LCGC14_3078740 [marine sediment metagenome]|uniref:Uncharacterized protein n=1 Tax=marine sediment metagenome TaxID=412755 RepID=A0A0F8YLI0_9ZZZZ
MSELTVEQVEELNIEMETWNSRYHEKYKPLFADWHRQRGEIEELEQANHDMKDGIRLDIDRIKDLEAEAARLLTVLTKIAYLDCPDDCPDRVVPYCMCVHQAKADALAAIRKEKGPQR